jgi:hypothetical protein
MTGHENEIDGGILLDQFFHIVDISLRIVTIDAAPRPHHHIDMAVG